MNDFDRKREKLHQQFRLELELPIECGYRPRGRYNPMVYHPECPYAKKGGKVIEAHYVWWLNHPEDPILKKEHIHHINLDRSDNRIENLSKVKAGPHIEIHREIKRQQLFKEMDKRKWYNPVSTFVGNINNPKRFVENAEKQQKEVP